MSELRLHNTLSGKKEVFTPVNPERVTVYVCGPTVYNYVHIGNGRPAVVFDVLVRLLRGMYPEVVYAANVTDIDDKINNAAKESGESIESLTERFTEAYHKDTAALGVAPPDIVPRATHHIDVIIDMIEQLISSGHAYANEGHVLFHVPADDAYGKLSRRSLDDMLAGARVDVAPYKKDAKDFVLWKPSDEETPGWPSPWGRGRPGWHIECSAMIKKHLGEVIDIHGGGSDLIFPHHENEAAQSRCANQNEEYVRFWLHNGMLTLGDEKMSKSLGNVRTIHALSEQYDGEILRYALLSGQYRSSLAWTSELLEQAEASLNTLYQALRNFPGDTQAQHYALTDVPECVLNPLLDDLNTPLALAGLHQIASAMNREPQQASELRGQLLAGSWMLGLLHQDCEAWFQGAGTGAGSDEAMSADDIEAAITARKDARAAGDYARADEIRDELTALGIELEDTREGTRWRRR